MGWLSFGDTNLALADGLILEKEASKLEAAMKDQTVYSATLNDRSSVLINGRLLEYVILGESRPSSTPAPDVISTADSDTDINFEGEMISAVGTGMISALDVGMISAIQANARMISALLRAHEEIRRSGRRR
jgi:hypothetical protein